MDLLLDTHSFLWFAEGLPSISKKAKDEIENNTNRCFVSIASLWEIAIKLSLDKLEMTRPFENIPEILKNNDVQILPVQFRHLQQLLILPMHHRYPFDRLIISQAITENLVIITKDGIFERYTSHVLW
ncbi:MAG TPA: type II toxin-antitoxin system VapC family toxin [Agriterribacter sp.]|nr:type II toxin-antitoxin system VapC family toxin [Agriterribacter sp.]